MSILLEEIKIEYEAHKVVFGSDGTASAEFLSANPNGKIPLIFDPSGPAGKPIYLSESGAILIYLAEKHGAFIGQTEEQKYNIFQWLIFQMSSVGPTLGQLGYFYAFEGKKIEDSRPLNRYLSETKRILKMIDAHLERRVWLADTYSIADIAMAPWLSVIERFYDAADVTELDQFLNIKRYLENFNSRPAVLSGMNIPKHDWGR